MIKLLTLLKRCVVVVLIYSSACTDWDSRFVETSNSIDILRFIL